MASNSKSSSWYKIAVIAATYITLYMVFVAEPYLVRMVTAESAMNQNFYSEEVAAKAEDRGTEWFKKLFVNTGVVAHSFEMFIPTDEERAKAKGTEDVGQPLFVWFEARVRAWWTLIWSTLTRLSSILLWLPYAPFALLPWLVDGWVQRERRKHTFEFSSPVKHRYAMMAATTMPLVFVVLLTAPVAMNPLVVPLMLLGMGVMGHQAIANFMKRA